VKDSVFTILNEFQTNIKNENDNTSWAKNTYLYSEFNLEKFQYIKTLCFKNGNKLSLSIIKKLTLICKTEEEFLEVCSHKNLKNIISWFNGLVLPENFDKNKDNILSLLENSNEPILVIENNSKPTYRILNTEIIKDLKEKKWGVYKTYKNSEILEIFIKFSNNEKELNTLLYSLECIIFSSYFNSDAMRIYIENIAQKCENPEEIIDLCKNDNLKMFDDINILKILINFSDNFSEFNELLNSNLLFEEENKITIEILQDLINICSTPSELITLCKHKNLGKIINDYGRVELNEHGYLWINSFYEATEVLNESDTLWIPINSH